MSKNLAYIGATLLAIQALAADSNTIAVATKIHRVNQMEIQMGQLAQRKATDKRVRSYANLLLQNYTRADEKLTRLMSEKGLSFRDAQSSQRANGLEQLRGTDFDQEFIHQMEQDHIETIDMIKTEQIDLGNRSWLSLYISELLPILEAHKQQASLLARQFGSHQISSK